jgi:hypothetical protein
LIDTCLMKANAKKEGMRRSSSLYSNRQFGPIGADAGQGQSTLGRTLVAAGGKFPEQVTGIGKSSKTWRPARRDVSAGVKLTQVPFEI